MTVRLGTAAVALALALALTGCWSRVEINDLAIVSLMALDRAEDGKVQLWMHVVIPATAGYGGTTGGQAGGQSSPAYVTLTGKGRTVMEAARFIQTKLSRRIFWGHTQVILFGEQLARDGLRPVIDFLTRHRELRLTNFVLVVRGSVPELLRSNINLEKLPVVHIREIVRSHIGTAVTLRDWVQDAAAEGADPMMGVVEVVPPPPGALEGQGPTLKVSGTALFREQRMVGFMDERVTRGLLWLRDEVRLGVVTMQVGESEGQVSLEWVNSRVKHTPTVRGRKIVIYTRATTEGDIIETQAPLDLSDPTVLEKVEKAMSREIEERMRKALAVLRELNVDAVGFGELIHRDLPQVWQQIRDDWKEKWFREVEVVIDVDAQARRTGLSSRPKGVPKEELVR